MKSQTAANLRYRSKHCKGVYVQFYPSDMELYEYLNEQENKSGYIKDLIREDMGHGERQSR